MDHEMRIRVRYFAAARELCGRSEEEVEMGANERSASEIVDLLCTIHPLLGPHRARMRVAVNGEIVALEHRVRAGDEVVVLPPVAGGSESSTRVGSASSTRVGICDARISIDDVVSAVAHAGAGGIAIFVGVVRDHADGKAVAGLDYEAYRELAEKEMARILDAIEAERPGVRVAAHHRVGSLAVGDLAVVVAASAPHRGDAFDACRAAIERIKETVPIWKKEWAPDGSAVWVNLEG